MLFKVFLILSLIPILKIFTAYFLLSFSPKKTKEIVPEFMGIGLIFNFPCKLLRHS